MSQSTIDTSSADVSSWPMAKRHEVINRFEKRVADAVLKSAPSKERVKNAIKRRGSDRPPCRLKRISYELILRYQDDLADLFCEYPDDTLFMVPYHFFVGYQPATVKNRIDPVQVLLDDARWHDEWGVEWGHVPGGVGATPTDIALHDWSDLDDYLANRFPATDVDGRLATADPIIAGNPHKHLTGCIYTLMFERPCFIRGTENFLTDFYTNPEEVERFIDRHTEFLLEIVRGWGQRGVDMVAFFEDWGTQISLMISPAMWRQWFKPRYKKLFDEAHKFGMDVFLHSCGAITEIIPDLIDIGLDILDPIQPGPVDHELIAREFGGKISFSGGIDVQNLLVYAHPQQVRDTIHRLKDRFATPFGNGLLLSPANVLTPEVPLENLRALFEACHRS